VACIVAAAIRYLTQTWLAVSDDPVASASGRYWYHRKPGQANAAASDSGFQDRLMAKLAELTGIALVS
jgi:hypothetical protein